MNRAQRIIKEILGDRNIRFKTDVDEDPPGDTDDYDELALAGQIRYFTWNMNKNDDNKRDLAGHEGGIWKNWLSEAGTGLKAI
jgi:hypothetical protein